MGEESKIRFIGSFALDIIIPLPIHKSLLATDIFWLLIISLSCQSECKVANKTLIQFSLHPALQADDKFVVNLTNQESFSMCSLLIFQDGYQYEDSATHILENVRKSAYLIKHEFPSGLHIRRNASAIESQKDTSFSCYPVCFDKSVRRFHRKGDQCKIVILFLNDTRSEFMHQIFNLLTPVFLPITRKDEDFYIFKTSPKDHENLLLMNELPARIKFKTAVGLTFRNVDAGVVPMVSARTICFFCGPVGSATLMELPVTKQNLPLSNFDYFPDFVWNLNGKLLQVSYPYTHSKIEGDAPWEGTSNARRGNWKYLMEEFLTVKFNFTYRAFPGSGKDGRIGGGGSGVELPNGTWIGVTGDLANGKADLGIVVANTPKRILAIDFTDSFYDAGCLTFVTAQPSQVYSSAAFLWPFDLFMWICICVSVALTVVFFSGAFKAMNIFGLGSGEHWKLRMQFEFVIITVLEQDLTVHPRSSAMRSFVALWLFYSLILTTVYRSKMVTQLAFPVLGELPKTFEDLAFSDYGVGFVKHGDSAYNTFAASTDQVYVKLVAEMKIFRGYGLECLEKVVNEKYGCIAYDFALVHAIERNLSEADTQKLVFAPATTYNVWLGLATEGKSIYRQNFGKILGYARPMHLADIWDKMDMYYNVRLLKLDWWRESGQMDKARHLGDKLDNLNLKNIKGAFYVLFAFLLLSCVIFGQEMASSYGAFTWNVFSHRFSIRNISGEKFSSNNF